MKYMLLNFRDEAAAANMTQEEQMQEIQDYTAFFEYASQRATIISGEALHPTGTATTIRVRDGKTLTTDGPFAETREGLAGFNGSCSAESQAASSGGQNEEVNDGLKGEAD